MSTFHGERFTVFKLGYLIVPPSSFTSPKWFKACLRQTGLSLGIYGEDRIDAQAVQHIAMPVVDGQNNVIAVAFAALSLDRMNRAIVDLLARLPVQADLMLTDDECA